MNIPIGVFCWIFFAGSSCPAGEPVPDRAREPGIKEGRLVKGSLSPDGKHGLFEYNHFEGPNGGKTITLIGLAPADRSKLLFNIDSRTTWQTDKEVPGFLSWKWNAGGTLLATHDSGHKHSKVCIYRIAGDQVAPVDLPDILGIAAAKLGIKKEDISSSGQVPVRWSRDDLLDISVRVKTKKGNLSAKVPIVISGEGVASTQ